MTDFADKARTIGYLSKGRSDRRRVIAEGRHHHESGEPFKTVRDECGNDVTEHGKPGTGLSDRQDVNINVAKPIEVEL